MSYLLFIPKQAKLSHKTSFVLIINKKQILLKTLKIIDGSRKSL